MDRFDCWAGRGLPKGWAKNMGLTGEDVGDVVWPITDGETCGDIQGFPKPEQVLCWCPSSEKADFVAARLEATDKLLAACKAALLFHGAAHWTIEEKTKWWNITQRSEATTKILCDTIRKAIAEAEA